MSQAVLEPAASGAAAKSAVSYIRVSTKEQAERDGDPEGYSLPAQRLANRRKAETIGAIVVEEFSDRGESAKTADRPKLREMLTYIRENRVDYVIVHKVDRLARNRLDDAEINLAIRQAGAELVSATENIDETPSGMLMHGIMSSIAEFYSRNLAHEVNKGMEQKAKTGGTPGKAPLGYRNVRRDNPDGREVRTVDIDPERAQLITWAFLAYATGDWTLKSLAAELERRGLTTRPTPRTPGRAIKYNSLHKILTAPYYKGEVTYRGVTYPGRHQPLIDVVTWEQVQDVLQSHATGEKQREHPHYLKSSLFCGGCGSRMIVTNAKNRYGTVYPYFICLGRHQKTHDCTQRAVLITLVEERIEQHYESVRLDPKLADQIEAVVSDDLQSFRATADADNRELTVQKDRLTSERLRLLQAHYAGAVPLDLLKTEQDRIARQLAGIEDRLSATTIQFDRFEKCLKQAINYAVNCDRGYAAAGHYQRRLFNQALFTHVFVEDEVVRTELAEPFKTLMSAEVAEAAKQHAELAADQRVSEGTPTLSEILGPDTQKPAPRGAGLKQTTLVPSAGFEPATYPLGEGCSIP